jgi:MFS transporter, SHS family, lactate transporter
MGGIWGPASANALEIIPVQLRGLFSGILQEGYALGCIIASLVNLWLVPEQKEKWKTLFWTAAGLSLVAAILRASLPESEIFENAQKNANNLNRPASSVRTRERFVKTKKFAKQLKKMLKEYWFRWIYAIIFMSCFNFLAHGSQVSSSSSSSFFRDLAYGVNRTCILPTCKSRNTRRHTKQH